MYLSSAREHPPAVVQRQQQHDLGVLLPALEGLSELQGRLFFLTASVIARFKPDDLQRLVDADIADAASALASTFETAHRGVIYEHRPTSLVAQRLGAELKTVYAQVGEKGGSRFERDLVAALRAMEKGARAQTRPGAETAYLELLQRVVGSAAHDRGRAEVGDEPKSGSIIIPGSA